MGLTNQGNKIRFPNKCRTELSQQLTWQSDRVACGRSEVRIRLRDEEKLLILPRDTIFLPRDTIWWLDLFLVLFYVSCSAQIPESRTFFGRVWGD